MAPGETIVRAFLLSCLLQRVAVHVLADRRDEGTPQHTPVHAQSDNTNTREHLADSPYSGTNSETPDVDSRQESGSVHEEAPPTEQPDDRGLASEEGIGGGSLEMEEERVNEGNAQEEEEEESERKAVPTSRQPQEEQDYKEELVDTRGGDQVTRPRSTPSRPSDGGIGNHQEGSSEGRRYRSRGEEYAGKASWEGDDEKVMESEWKRAEARGEGGGETREEREGEEGGEGGEEGERVEGMKRQHDGKPESRGEDPVLNAEDSGIPGGEAAEEERGTGKMNEEEEEEEQKEKEPEEGVFAEGLALVAKADPMEKLKGYDLMKKAADAGNTRAQEELAYAHLFGTVLERNFTKSYEIFGKLADKGNSIGQQGLGFMYSTGIGVNSSQAKAVLYYTFAALGGHHYAQMAMGYRSMMGISVVQSCEAALTYYHKAARKVADEVTLITGGLLVSKVRLIEEDDEATNVYGVSEGDMIHYHNVFADSGNTGAQILLGVYYMYGMAGAERDFRMALKFLLHAGKEGVAAAYALIGKIYAEGSPEVPQDYDAAMTYFKKAKDQNHADGYCGIGMMYLSGMGVEQDYSKALEHLQKAADKGSAEGQYYLGHMFYNGLGTQRNLNKALRYFQLSSHGGHVLGLYYLAEMHAEGIGVKRNCNYAVGLFKGVAERGKWARILDDAERSYMAGDLDSALVIYLLLAEMGLEVAQTNAAYILEQDGVTLVHPKETLKRALILWNRSASQGYSMARVKLGDYYYYGQGTEVNYEAAAGQYRIASDKQSSAQAMFNLAYMYECGLGLQKDYHLAKRYYDLAAETSTEAHVPVVLALMKLNVLYYYESYLELVASPVVSQAVETLHSVAGENWDMYLITLLSGLLALVFIWRWRHQL